MKRDERKNPGILLGLLFVLCNSVSKAFRSGALFRSISSKRDDNDPIEASSAGGFVLFLKKKSRKITETVKKFVARQFERSSVLRLFVNLFTYLVNLPGRVLGAFGLTWSAYVILIELIKLYANSQQGEAGSDIIVGAVTFVASLPLMFTDKSLRIMAKDSAVISLILYKVFGIPDESLKPLKFKKYGQSGAVILGVLLGLATYYVSPLDMIVGALAFVAVVLVMCYPEGGVLISIAISPLLGLFEHSSIILAVSVLLTALSYFLKVMRGKRVYKVDLSGLAVYSFLTVILISGFTPGESNTVENALLCAALMLIFPLIVNLMNHRHWIKACIVAFAVPSAIVAVVGVIQYYLGFSPSGWVDETMFSSITHRAVSVFNNPNILGVYLASMFPIALMLTTSNFSKKIRTLGGISAAYILVASILTFSRSAWLALLVGGILFAVTVSPKGILWLIPAGAAAAALAIIFPDTVGIRLLNFVSVSDSANNYRIDVWNSSWNLLKDTWLFGIGWGEEAFKTAYINYGADGTQYAMHSHSLYMQIVIQTGIAGLVTFSLAIVTVAKKSFSLLSGIKTNNMLSVVASAALCGAVAIMTAGVFDYTWYNFRVFFVFWALLAFACAAVNVDRNESMVWAPETDEYYSYVTVSIPSEVEMKNENK